MKTVIVSLLAIVSVYGAITIANAEEPTTTQHPDVAECLKKSRGLLKKMLKTFNVCNKELKSKEKTAEEFQESIGCVIKCVMHKEGVLDENDKLTEKTMKEAIEMHIPEKYRNHIHEMGIGCIKSYGGDNLDTKDPNCKSYNVLGTCIQEVYADVCGSLPPI